jgi:hypothetical protein
MRKPGIAPPRRRPGRDHVRWRFWEPFFFPPGGDRGACHSLRAYVHMCNVYVCVCVCTIKVREGKVPMYVHMDLHSTLGE